MCFIFIVMTKVAEYKIKFYYGQYSKFQIVHAFICFRISTFTDEMTNP